MQLDKALDVGEESFNTLFPHRSVRKPQISENVSFVQENLMKETGNIRRKNVSEAAEEHQNARK